MEKVLKKYTTIPDHLYIKRKADNQLKTIVEEMERPGYVLVARQMGKTNLLINAKRTLENENRLFIYVDLSNVFEFENDCYRNIIDDIIEPNEHIFKSIESDIFKIRQQNLPPNKEYFRSLRIILNFFKGDLIIILDEVDALKSAKYSDQIFAQIRSNYFARTNFPCFCRLTYVLSGVIEPTELIKDRNKSPFNIGDKIYLDDFTIEEHCSFIKKSKLKISQIDSDEIFSWTNGNPRLTFDICSEIEDHIIDGFTINKEIISDIIKKLYLKNFDIAPVDHIRELVKSSKSLRTAVVDIHNENSNLSDEIKNKLYLSGIINSDFNKRTVIKNKVIAESLSLEWINKQSQNTVASGFVQYENKEYDNAIETFASLLSDPSTDDSGIEVSHYYSGYAYYKLGDFDNAIRFFSFEFQDDTFKRTAFSLLGNCKLKTEFEESVNLFETVIKIETNDFAYHNALLNLGANLQQQDSERAFSLFQQLFESTFKAKDSIEDSLNQLRTLALYYQAQIYNNNKKTTEALEKIRAAKEYASISDSLHLIFFEYSLEGNKSEYLKEEIIQKIVDNKIRFDIEYSHPISFNAINLSLYISLVHDNSDLKLFDKILDYSENYLFMNQKDRNEIIYDASRINIDKRLDLLKFLLKRENDIKDPLLIEIYKDLTFLYLADHSKFSRTFSKYLKIFKRKEKIDKNDIQLFAFAIQNKSDGGKIDEGLKLCDTIESRLSVEKDEELSFESLIIYYWYASLYFSINNKVQSTVYANRTLNLIGKSKKERTSFIDKKGLKLISEQMTQIKSSSIKRKPFVSGKKHGRNDKITVKYLDGKIKETKYKKIEADLLLERCKIIS